MQLLGGRCRLGGCPAHRAAGCRVLLTHTTLQLPNSSSSSRSAAAAAGPQDAAWGELAPEGVAHKQGNAAEAAAPVRRDRGSSSSRDNNRNRRPDGDSYSGRPHRDNSSSSSSSSSRQWDSGADRGTRGYGSSSSRDSSGRDSRRYHDGDYTQGPGSRSSSTSGGSRGSSTSSSNIKPRDWECPDCGAHNFARRQTCIDCQAPRPGGEPHSSSRWDRGDAAERPFQGVRGSSSIETKPGDWECPQCASVNFAWRTACFSCNTSRPPQAAAAAAGRSSTYTRTNSRGQTLSSSSSSSSRGMPSSSGRAASSSSSSSRSLTGSGGDGDREARKKASSLLVQGVPCCYGCGAPLQDSVPAAAGYVEPAKLETKRQHRQLKQVLCGRCSSLANGAMIPAVKDFTQKAWLEQQSKLLLEHKAQQQQQQHDSKQQQLGQQRGEQQREQQGAAAASAAAGGDGGGAAALREPLELLGKVLVTAEELRDKIAEVSSVKALVVMLVDLLDVSGTLMGKVRDMVGNNPIVLVGTKLDLLPEGTHPKEVAQWLTDAAARKRLQVTSTHLVSSRSGEGVASVAAKIGRERKGRDVFVVGAANVGKSAFVRALLREMSSLSGGNFDAAAASTSRYLPVESAMPGTTLGIIPLRAFESGGTLFDTPGVHLHHRVPHMLSPQELKLLHPRRRLAPFRPPSPLDVMMQEQQEQQEEAPPTGSSSSRGSSSSSSVKKPKVVSASYLWSGLVRVDVLSGGPSTSLVFYGPRSLRVAALPLLQEGQTVEWEEEGEEEGEGDEGETGDGAQPEQQQQQQEWYATSSSTSGSSSSSRRQRYMVCKESVAARGGLVPHLLTVPVPPNTPATTCLADVAVSGLPGWVSVFSPFAAQAVQLRVWVPRGVEVFLRPPLPCPPPPKPSRGVSEGEGEEEEGGAVDAADLADIGAVLASSEAHADWERDRAELGLRPMSAEDEEVIKMLLYGSEEQGLTGIVEMDDEEGLKDEWEEEEEDAELAAAAAAAAAGPAGAAGADSSDSHSEGVVGSVAGSVASVLRAEQLALTAAEAIVPKGRGSRARTSSSSSRRVVQGGLTVVDADDEADGAVGGAAAVLAGGSRRRRRV